MATANPELIAALERTASKLQQGASYQWGHMGACNCGVEFPSEGCARDSKGSCSLALHAEQNAILYAVKNNTSVEGSTLYVTLAPCLACARIIFSMGISKVVYLFSYAEYKGIGSDEGVDFLVKFGVNVQRYSKSLEVSDHLI